MTNPPPLALPRAAAALQRDAARELLGGGVLLLLTASGVAALAGLGAAYVAKALLLYAAACALVWRGLAGSGLPRFGAANRVTLLRMALGLMLAAVIGEPVGGRDDIAWTIVVVATVTAVLDAADGPLARAQGLASEFGARFDMETDAALLLVLCLLLMHFDKAGAWILAAGLMRYAFVAAMRVWPWLGAPLPPSLRRKTVCVAQITLLIVGLGPIVVAPWSTAYLGAGLALLAYSFAVDVRWLRRARRLPPPPEIRP